MPVITEWHNSWCGTVFCLVEGLYSCDTLKNITCKKCIKNGQLLRNSTLYETKSKKYGENPKNNKIACRWVHLAIPMNFYLFVITFLCTPVKQMVLDSVNPNIGWDYVE